MSKTQPIAPAIVALGALLLAVLAAPVALANSIAKPRPVRPHVHARTHFYFGGIIMPGPVIYPKPVPAPGIYEAPAPTVYVEKGELEAAGAGAAGVWYFCTPLNAYYPYTPDCPQAWVTVPAESVAPP